MDQHEPLHPYLYAGKFIDRWRNELVAGNSYNFSRKYGCFDSDDIEWTCRGKIWNSISCFCKSKFWNKRSKYSGDAPCHRCLWLVWNTNMDRWCMLCIRLMRVWNPWTMPEIYQQFFVSQTGPDICFLLFWLLNMYIVYLGVESIRKLLVFKASFFLLLHLHYYSGQLMQPMDWVRFFEQPSKFQGIMHFLNFFFLHLQEWLGFGQHCH